jgi:hypothetical protein
LADGVRAKRAFRMRELAVGVRPSALSMGKISGSGRRPALGVSGLSARHGAFALGVSTRSGCKDAAVDYLRHGQRRLRCLEDRLQLLLRLSECGIQ